MALADRILVMFRGRVVGERPAGTDRDEIGLLMAGVEGREGREGE
jgi:general nucleoside transport system ATP-binding protein